MSRQRKEPSIAMAHLARPLTPRSAVASLLLGMHPPRIRGALLVRWCRHLGIEEGATRTALSRMTDRGELVHVDGRYELVGDLRSRQESQDWSLEPVLRAWHGTWVLWLVASGGRGAAARAALRRAAARARLAELREGVWARPDNLPPEAVPAEANAVLTAQATPWRATAPADENPDVHALFATRATAERTRLLTERLVAVTASLREGAGLAEAFAAGAAALQQIRRDPLLPPALVGSAWPGPDLRRAYVAYREVFGRAVQAFFDETGELEGEPKRAGNARAGTAAAPRRPL